MRSGFNFYSRVGLRTLVCPSSGPLLSILLSSHRQYTDGLHSHHQTSSTTQQHKTTHSHAHSHAHTHVHSRDHPHKRGMVEAEIDEDVAVEEALESSPPPSPLSSSSGTVKVRNHLNAPVNVQPIRRFADIAEELPDWLNHGIASAGHQSPTVVQSYAIPLLMEEKDMIGIAPTGSGKTVAFAIPALASVSVADRRRNGKSEPSVLVLCPTRELAQQTKNVFVTLGGGRVMTRAVFGGQDRHIQQQYLSQGAEVLVATPGRLCDFIDSGEVSLEKVDFFVLDEADRMLEMGFAPQLKHIVQKLPKNPVKRRITMMWSATWSRVVEGLASGMLHPTQRLTVEVTNEHKISANIQQLTYGTLDPSEKLRKIVDIYEQGLIVPTQKVIIFANHKETVEHIADELAKALRVGNTQLIQGLHGGMRQPKRDAIMRKFRSGEIVVLVATDVAARGLDVPDIEHVINYDLPTDTDRYVHRIGRTGRAGRKGVSHTIFSVTDSTVAADLADFIQASGASLPRDVVEVVAKSRFSDNSRVFKRYQSTPVTSSAQDETDWRGDRVPGAPSHHHHRGGSSGRRPQRTITLKRDPSPM